MVDTVAAQDTASDRENISRSCVPSPQFGEDRQGSSLICIVVDPVPRTSKYPHQGKFEKSLPGQRDQKLVAHVLP